MQFFLKVILSSIQNAKSITFSSILIIILSSSVISALVSSIFNLLTQRKILKNKDEERKIENVKTAIQFVFYFIKKYSNPNYLYGDIEKSDLLDVYKNIFYLNKEYSNHFDEFYNIRDTIADFSNEIKLILSENNVENLQYADIKNKMDFLNNTLTAEEINRIESLMDKIDIASNKAVEKCKEIEHFLYTDVNKSYSKIIEKI